MTIGRMRTASWTTKAVYTKYVTLIAFPLPQWLHEHVWMLRYMYIACLVSFACYTFISRYSKWPYNVCGLPAAKTIFMFSSFPCIWRVQQNVFAVNWHIIIIKCHYRLHVPAHGRNKHKRKYVQNTSVSHHYSVQLAYEKKNCLTIS